MLKLDSDLKDFTIEKEGAKEKKKKTYTVFSYR